MNVYLQFGSESFRIPPGDLVRVGKAEDCEIRLTHDIYISRRHCSLSLLDSILTVVDLRSSHGTIVNGQLIGNRPMQLNDGDVLQLGNTELTIRFAGQKTRSTDIAHYLSEC